MTHTRADNLEIEEPAEALKYLQFRAENRNSRWANAKVLGGQLLMSLRIHSDTAETPTRMELIISRQPKAPTAVDRYRIDKALHRLGLKAVATEEVRDTGVRMWLAPVDWR